MAAATHNLLTTLQNGARARLQSISLPYTKASVGIASVLLNHGFIQNAVRGTGDGPSPSDFLNASPAGRRLWVDIKYGQDDRAVLGHARIVSKPSRRIFLSCQELLRLVTGRRAQFINPLTLGEIAIVRCETKRLREAGTSMMPRDTAESGADAAIQAIVESTLAPPSELRSTEEWLEAREAVGRGLGGEVIARVG